MSKAICKGVIEASAHESLSRGFYSFPFLKSGGFKPSGILPLEEEEGSGEKDNSEEES